ncbi:MAG: glycogen/starch synthase [Bacteroidales bacterium]|nr:glycogen/starch synthase [Bacteroidales bacterium]
MSKPKVLFVSQEIEPYLKNTPLSTIGRNLPQYTQEHGKEIRIFMPRFGNVNERRNQLHEVIRLSGINLVIDNQDHPLIIKVASIPSIRMQIYFIDNEDYFTEKVDITKADGSLLEDNDERTMFFARGVLETIKKLAWKPEIIHCSGWFSMLLPFYVKRTKYKDNPFFMESKVVLTLYDDDFGESLAASMSKKMKVDGGTQKDWRYYKEPTYLNIMKAAISYSEGVILASDKVNPELIAFAKENSKHIVEYVEDEKELYAKINEYYDSIVDLDED